MRSTVSPILRVFTRQMSVLSTVAFHSFVTAAVSLVPTERGDSGDHGADQFRRDERRRERAAAGGERAGTGSGMSWWVDGAGGMDEGAGAGMGAGERPTQHSVATRSRAIPPAMRRPHCCAVTGYRKRHAASAYRLSHCFC